MNSEVWDILLKIILPGVITAIVLLLGGKVAVKQSASLIAVLLGYRKQITEMVNQPSDPAIKVIMVGLKQLGVKLTPEQTSKLALSGVVSLAVFLETLRSMLSEVAPEATGVRAPLTPQQETIPSHGYGTVK